MKDENPATIAVATLIGELLDAELTRTGKTHLLSSFQPQATGEVTARVLDALSEADADSMDPDLWLHFLLRAKDRGATPYAELFAALAAHGTGNGPAASAARMDAYGRLGAAVVRQLLRATDAFLAEELADHYHYQQALRRYRIAQIAEAINV